MGLVLTLVLNMHESKHIFQKHDENVSRIPNWIKISNFRIFLFFHSRSLK